jgi:hypothetical protein
VIESTRAAIGQCDDGHVNLQCEKKTKTGAFHARQKKGAAASR